MRPSLSLTMRGGSIGAHRAQTGATMPLLIRSPAGCHHAWSPLPAIAACRRCCARGHGRPDLPDFGSRRLAMNAPTPPWTEELLGLFHRERRDERSAPPTPRDLADAFANALLAYGDWSPGQPEREISIGQTKFSMTAVCGLFDQFADELPRHVFDKLRSYLDLISHSDLIVELAVNCSYATGARCLRRLIELRKAEYQPA
jgi:hypothetical protein